MQKKKEKKKTKESNVGKRRGMGTFSRKGKYIFYILGVSPKFIF